MQGLHVYERGARTIDLESFVALDHPLRKVDQVLDLSFIRELTARCYASRGRPSIDPQVYFRMVLVGYLCGIDSDRQLCDEIHHNMAYRWFCRLAVDDEVPDHSSFTRTRDRLGEEIFETVFRRIVTLCQQKGLVGEEGRVMTDATLIAADASLNSLIHNDSEEAEKESQTQDGDRGMKDSTTSRKISNQTHTSRTDPDATLAQKKGTPRQLKYKVHQTIAADSRVILDIEVTTGARHDNQPYLKQLQRIREKYNVVIREAIADRGYGSAAIIRSLQEQGIETYIPLWSGRVGNSKYLTGELVYEKQQDRFRCPEGKYLLPNLAIVENHKRYSASSDDCRDCPRANTCPARTKSKSHQKFVLRNLDQDLFERVKVQMREPIFRTRASERMWKIEGLFAEAKNNHGLKRARYRGRAKVQIQAYMIAIVQNLKRLVAVVWGLLENFRCQWPTIRHQLFTINSERIAEISFKSIPTFRISL